MPMPVFYSGRRRRQPHAHPINRGERRGESGYGGRRRSPNYLANVRLWWNLTGASERLPQPDYTRMATDWIHACVGEVPIEGQHDCRLRLCPAKNNLIQRTIETHVADMHNDPI